MTKKEIEVYECDNCGNEYDSDSNYIKQCHHCDNDYCDDCQEEHAKDECFG